MATPRVVVVTRRTEHDALLERHGTRGQVEFFLRSRGQDLEGLLARHQRTEEARRAALGAVPVDWRRTEVERAELARFVFEPADIVVVLGQDGLVANVAKYLDGQPVIGVDPLPGENAGLLVPHPVATVGERLADVAAGRATYTHRAMARVSTDDGQWLDGLNEVFLGQSGHQSARYELSAPGGVDRRVERQTERRVERQSSSGVIVGTGTGATGWCASIQRVQAPRLPLPGEQERSLAWFVREAWPSPMTGTTLVAGRLGEEEVLGLRCESEMLVAFGDGIEADRLILGWGQRVTVGVSPRALRTVA